MNINKKDRCHLIGLSCRWGVGWTRRDTDRLSLTAHWIVTIFACVRQLSSFSVSTTRQWAHFTLRQDYGYNDVQCHCFQSIRHMVNEKSQLSTPQLSFIQRVRVGSSQRCIHSWICWVISLNHCVHCKQDRPFSLRGLSPKRDVVFFFWLQNGRI